MNTKECPHCKKNIFISATLCKHCKKSLKASKCNHCGKKISVDIDVCNYCGKKIGSSHKNSDKKPSDMSSILQNRQYVFIQQQKEWTEILTDWETHNRYMIFDERGCCLGYIGEKEGKFADLLKRSLLKSHRPLEIEVSDLNGNIVLRLSRKFFFLFSHLCVDKPDKSYYGSIQRRFGIIYRNYDLKDNEDKSFASIKNPIWHLWTFSIYDQYHQIKATISKRWGGALTEAFTDADTFCIDFGTHDWTPSQRAVILAASISIDFDFFEK